MSERIPHIFLSYAKEDFIQVEEIYNKLSEAGFNPWMDKKNILPGEKWENRIGQAIQRSDFVLIFLSAVSTNKRGYFQKEIRKFLNLCEEKLDSDIYLIPVRLEECQVPDILSEYEWVDIYEADGWNSLMRSIVTGTRRYQPYKVRDSSEEKKVKEESIFDKKIREQDKTSNHSSSLYKLSTHPLLIILICFVMVATLGGYLMNTYIHRQQELASRSRFSDDLTRTRIQKIGEVWEQIDKTESSIDELLDRVSESPNSNNNDKILDDIAKLIAGEMEVINKNRFWLGEENYNQLKKYMDINKQYVTRRLTEKPGVDLTYTVKKREQAKQDIIRLKEFFLNRELER